MTTNYNIREDYKGHFIISRMFRHAVLQKFTELSEETDASIFRSLASRVRSVTSENSALIFYHICMLLVNLILVFFCLYHSPNLQ
jgi:hypothetical protein